MWPSHTESKKPNASNVMGSMNLDTTNITLSATKITARPILLSWKLNRVNYALTPSNILTIETIIRQILIFVSSRNIGSITNSILKSIKKFVILKNNQFIQLWIVTKYNCKEHQDIFANHLPEQFHYLFNTWNPMWLWHYFHPRTILVIHMIYSKFKKCRRQRIGSSSQPSKLDFSSQESISR